MAKLYKLRRGAIYQERAEDVYPRMGAETVRLVVSDGPYAMRKADWDEMSLDALPEWYRSHVEAWTRLCMPSASVYLWGSAASWARLDPLMREYGWDFRGLIVWHKINARTQKMSVETARSWPDMTEVCGFYQRAEVGPSSSAGQEIGYAAGADDNNTVRQFICEEWAAAGLRRSEANTACGVATMADRHYFGTSQWALPTWEMYQRLAEYAQEHGAARGRPYFVLPEVWERPETGSTALRATHEALRERYEALRERYEALRESYEALRPPFKLPAGGTNVWRYPIVDGPERLRDTTGQALHPCQKPLEFAEMMIRASTRPGDLVLEPFGGTCRVAVACERLLGDEARPYVCIEPNGLYVEAVLVALRGTTKRSFQRQQQLGLFSGGDDFHREMVLRRREELAHE